MQGIATIQITGNDAQVDAMLMRMQVTLSPVSVGTFLKMTVDPYIRGRAKNRFSSEGDDVSEGWMPLRESTQETRGNAGYGAAGPINIRTGELEEFITGTPGGVGPNAMGATLTSPGTPPKGELYSKVRTAQEGKNYPPTPARPVMGVNEVDLVAVLTELSKFIAIGTAR